MPLPTVEKAMFTPSSVWAYWMRGSIGGVYPLPPGWILSKVLVRSLWVGRTDQGNAALFEPTGAVGG